jgi:hypothetical protein
LPETLIVREIRFRTKTKRGRVPRSRWSPAPRSEEYPAEELAALFLTRGAWRPTSRTTRHDAHGVLRSKTVEGVLARCTPSPWSTTRAAGDDRRAQSQRAPVERLSFVAALRWLALPTPEHSH